MAAYVSLLRTQLNRLYHNRHSPWICTIFSASSLRSRGWNKTEIVRIPLMIFGKRFQICFGSTYFCPTNTDRMYKISFGRHKCLTPLFELLRWNQSGHFILTNMLCLPPVRIFDIDDLQGFKWKFNK